MGSMKSRGQAAALSGRPEESVSKEGEEAATQQALSTTEDNTEEQEEKVEPPLDMDYQTYMSRIPELPRTKRRYKTQ